MWPFLKKNSVFAGEALVSFKLESDVFINKVIFIEPGSTWWQKEAAKNNWLLQYIGIAIF